jgi:hypothetical protein
LLLIFKSWVLCSQGLCHAYYAKAPAFTAFRSSWSNCFCP